MSLTQEAYLEIDDGDGNTATFQLNVALEESTSIDKAFIMAERGQFIQEIANQEVVDLGIETVEERRAGYWIDGGAGSETLEVSFETGLEDVTWGDGDGGSGAANVTKRDASGAGVHPLARKQVLEFWVRTTRTDSGGQARLHWGEWTDGTVGGASAGVFGQPIPVAVVGLSADAPDPDSDVNTMTGTLSLARVALFPSDVLPDWVTEPAAKIAEQIDGLLER